MGRSLIGGAAPGNHIGRDGPGGAGKADQGGFARQCRCEIAHRLIDRIEGFVDILDGFQGIKANLIGDG